MAVYPRTPSRLATIMAMTVLLLRSLQGFTHGTNCADKLEDCNRFLGRGPLGGGCERHPDYMRAMCARTCSFCSSSEPMELSRLQATLVSLLDVDAYVVSSKGVRSWHFFELPVAQDTEQQVENTTACATARTYVAAAHYYDSRTHRLNSSVYRWNARSMAFEEHQSLQTVGAWDLEAFEIDGDWYLAVASFFDGRTRKLQSTVYRWDARADAFKLHQELSTSGAVDVEFFGAGDMSFLVFTGASDGRDLTAFESVVQIFRWSRRSFVEFQSLPISRGYDAEAFTAHDGSQVLVIVHEGHVDVYRAKIAALSEGGEGFTLLQVLDVPHGRDAERFELDGVLCLAVAVFRGDASYEADSFMYAWNSNSIRLEEVQRLPGSGAFDAEVLEIAGAPQLLVASQREGVSRLYRRENGTVHPQNWVEQGSISTPHVYDVAWHHVHEAGAYYLGIARYWD